MFNKSAISKSAKEPSGTSVENANQVMPSQSDPMAISVNLLTKIFPNNQGIRNMNFAIPKGSFAVMVGENGAGKTTLIRCILRLYQQFAGEVKIDGINNADVRSFEGVSYISEQPKFPSEFNVYQYLMWVAKFAGQDTNAAHASVLEFIGKFNMEKFLKVNPNRLSSGEKQKVMLIKVLVEHSDIVILDEPTSNLDPRIRGIFFDEIQKLHKQGKTIIVCTHNILEVENKATYVIVVTNGTIAFQGNKTPKLSIEQLFNDNTEQTQKDVNNV